jgi:predicted short-subunit dehydrogenase-like oxidoreductase (DUF2520 family)
VSASPSVDDRPARLSVGVVGAGRVGVVLAAALAQAGHKVVAVSAVSDASRRRVDELLPGTPVLAPPQVLAAAELALHPAMTFTGRREDLARLVGACFGVTAPEPLRPIAEALVVEMGSDPQWVDEELRPLYHAALAAGSNHLATLVNESVDLLRRCGVEEPERLLAPLLGASLDNALRAGDAALTGPVARGDAGTVAAHISVLREVSPDTAAAYIAMARLTADRALAAGLLKPEAAVALLDVLAGGSR